MNPPAHTLGTGQLILSALAVGAALELILWWRRIGVRRNLKAMAEGRPAPWHPFNLYVIGALLLMWWAIYPARAAYALGRGGWWLIGYPVVLVNRQRAQAALERRRQAKADAAAQRILEHGTTPKAIAVAAHALEARHRKLPPPPPVFTQGVIVTDDKGRATFEPLELAP